MDATVPRHANSCHDLRPLYGCYKWTLPGYRVAIRAQRSNQSNFYFSILRLEALMKLSLVDSVSAIFLLLH